MSAVDSARLDRLRVEMKSAKLDALVCRLSENVVYLSDYGRNQGFSVVVLPREGRARLFVPEVEQEYTDDAWCDVTPFGWGLLKDGDLYANYRALLSRARDELRLGGARIGVERSFEVIGSTYRSAEPVVPALPWATLLTEVFSGSEVVDATDFLQTVRSVKSEYELGKLRLANEIAEMGMHEFLARLKPGLSEVQVGAMVEAKIRSEGPGHKGARLVRPMAEVGTGPVGSTKGTLLVPSTT